MELDPSLTSCSWLCCHETHFLGGVCLFQASDPTTGTSLVGATLPDCTSVYHTQAGWQQQGDLGFLLRKSRRRPLSLCCALAWQEAEVTLQGPLSTPIWPTQPCLGAARLLGIEMSHRKVGPCGNSPPLSCGGVMEGHLQDY